MSVISERLRNLFVFQDSLDDKTAVLISNPKDVTYFSGFEILVPEEREAFLCVCRSNTYLIHASFSPVETYPGITNLSGSSASALSAHLSEIVSMHNLHCIRIDDDSLFVSEYQKIRTIGISIESFDRKNIWQFRSIKTESEIENVRLACEKSAHAFNLVRTKIVTGMTEEELRDSLETSVRLLGCKSMAFPSIVAFGNHTSLPHYQPHNFSLAEDSVIMLDFGAKYKEYCADMTRTFWHGSHPSAEFLTVESVVLEAYNAGISLLTERIKFGKKVTAAEIDTVVRGVITRAGYGKYFIHTTGHGIGLDIHEQPSLNSSNQQPLLPGMIVTIEPGIYLPNGTGYRYENSILITENNVHELTKSS